MKPVEYTNFRDQVMDKFWLEFLESIKGYVGTSTYIARIDNEQFWSWFYTEKMKKTNVNTELKAYLR